MSTSTSRSVELLRLVALIRPYRGLWAIATLALLGGGAVNLALPQFLRAAIDDAIARSDTDRLGTILLWAMAGFVTLAALTLVRHYLMSWVGTRVVADLRDQTFRHLLTHPPGFFHERKSGELVSRLTSDIQMVHHAVGSELSVALRTGLTALGAIVILFTISPAMAAVLLAVIPPLSIGAVWVGRRIRRRSREVQDLIAEANSGLKEAVVGIETVQAFTAEAQEADRYGDRVFAAFRTGLGVALARGSFFAAVQLGGYSAVALILWLGARQVMAGTVSAGDLAAFLLYALIVTSNLIGLAQVWSNLQQALGATTRIFDLLDQIPQIRDSPEAVAPERIEGVLELEEVCFTYPSRPELQVLDSVSFEARPGEVVALVGQSGAGKSTVAALILRFYDPDAGRIRLDGRDLREIRIESLRSATATVHQEPMLFSGTIAENIAYGCPDAGRETVQRAAEDAHIADFVATLPEGFDTLVGERGVKLSGGQRQRVAIARALLADPRLLILDEATSHLDTESEALVQEALARLMRGRTTLVIAHRLSTVRDADRILVLHRGRVVESGRHEELLERGEVYRALITNQAVIR